MYSDKDFQTFWFRYKTEGEPHGISINSFCVNQGVPYKQFYAWFKKHAKDTVIPVEIEGMPDNEDEDDAKTKSKASVNAKSEKPKSKTSAEYDPSQGMTEQELHNFCRFLYSQLQAKDEEIKHLSSNVMELTQEVRLSRLQQQSVNDEHMAANASASRCSIRLSRHVSRLGFHSVNTSRLCLRQSKLVGQTMRTFFL